MPKKNLLQISRGIVWIIAVFLFLFCYWERNIQGMFRVILVIFFLNLCFALVKFENRMAYTLFLASFFCFMLGRMSMEFFTKGSVNFYFADDITIHTLISIFISLIFLQLGVELCENRWKNSKPNGISKEYKKELQKYAQILFCIAGIIAIAMNIEQILFVHKYSYVGLFKEFVSNIPRIFQVLGNMYIASFIVFLSTFPSKKDCVFSIVLFSVVTVTILLTGDRGTFVCNFAVLVVYIFWRQYIDHEIWISKKLTIIGIACIPLLLAGMSFFVYIREGVDVGERTVIAQIIRFFKASGNSVDILSYGKEYQEHFPKSFYSFGELIDYVKYNPISQVLFNTVKPKPHTVEYVEIMHSYAHSISYFISPDEYLLGHGRGSSYIAEAYHDFGYIGIGVCNLIYGMFLAGIYKLNKYNPFVIASAFIALRILFYVPRGPMISPISYILNITTVSAMFFLWAITKYQSGVWKYINIKKGE